MRLSLPLRRAYFWAILILLTLVSFAASVPFLLFTLLFLRDKRGITRQSIWLYSRVLLFLLRPVAPIHVKNPKAALVAQPCIIVPNHQSFFDLYLMACQDCANLCLVVAKWPFKKLFFYAPFMILARYVRVGSMELNESFIQRCAEALHNGATIVCFAEGTRSRDGVLGDFHSGIFRVAAATATPIVPMLFYNSGKVCPPGSLAVVPQPIYAELLDAVRPGHGEKAHYALRGKVREQMLKRLEHFEMHHPQTRNPRRA